MSDNTQPDYLLPADAEKVISIHDGRRWLYGVRPGSLQIDTTKGVISFTVNWSGQLRRYKLALSRVAGYEESE
jgi:hypothetical protein